MQYFRPKHLTEEEAKAKTRQKKETRAGRVLLNSHEIDRWTPFEIKGVELHGLHIKLSILRVFQQFADEDSFRSEFVGRHAGLQWLRDQVYVIEDDDVKLMVLRLLLQMSVDPFGMDDICEDETMLKAYIKMERFKELSPGSKDYTAQLVEHSRHQTVRMKMHRVAEFLNLDHTNSTTVSKSGHTTRMVTVARRANMYENAREQNRSLLEIVRERALEECFPLLRDSAVSTVGL
eukprot:COSAG05_NODE_15_length_36348_cov_78.369307_4_plen_234_part_00